MKRDGEESWKMLALWYMQCVCELPGADVMVFYRYAEAECDNPDSIVKFDKNIIFPL